MLIEFLRNPKNTGSVIPSSRFLVNEMLSHISKEDTLIELGAGTGVITKKLASIESVKTIYTYENNDIYHRALKNIDKTICLSNLFTMKEQHKNQKIKTIISSIPFVNFSIESRNQALNDISKILDDDGLFIQYTYRNRCPFGDKYLCKNNLKIKNVKKIWLNIPPATVFVYEKIN
ncbi:hypothetical protein PVK62_08995 [Aliivibrio sp. S3MY1]|uniref:class I SAM-dependent methyltransferase n=1 Tax=unclassified Aliivibrio TaxID=2645654 RepID=UPI0023780BE0|nr:MULTISPECIES: hypothetical protein [unclassified Aliivibrio]MDD9195967.1 hypothetical protein [Aliivibrio sp. S3MY1]MDD9200333.1 hypothetical protein [Aliivibrio sp. S2MY1]